MEFANAGHNPFILVRNDREAEYRKMMPGLVLAAFPDVTFENEHLTLHTGETILMYTDGITEAMNSHHKLFGEKRLLELIIESGSLAIPDLIGEITKGVAQFVDGNEQSDDITILALRFLA